MTDAVEGAEVDEDVDEGVEVSDGFAVAEFRAFDAEFDGLGVDALGGGALFVEALVGLAGVVELVAGLGSWTERQGGDAAAVGQFLWLVGQGWPVLPGFEVL